VAVRPKTYFGDRKFESRRVHEFSSLVFTVCCVGIGLCDEMITRSEESYRVCVSNLRHLRGGLGPIWAVDPKQQNIVHYNIKYSIISWWWPSNKITFINTADAQ